MPADLFFTLSLVVMGFLGACCGSFASALAHRYIHRQDWVAARSACPACGHSLGPFDLIPVLSWVLQRGRCRYCRAPYGVQYLVFEILGAFAALSAYAQLGWTLALLPVMLAVPVLLTLAAIDLRTFLLPDRFVIVLGGLGLVHAVLETIDQPVMAMGLHILGVLVRAVLYAGLLGAVALVVGWVLKKESLGMGDIKLVLAMGVWLPLVALPVFYLAAGILGIAVGLVWQTLRGQGVFPFGPALIAGFWLTLTLYPLVQPALDGMIATM